MAKKTYYITTPIYYSNWVPHIWHSYSSLLADSIARTKRLLWYKVKFSTWVDENSQKMIIKAKEEWKELNEYLDEMANAHKSVWDWLNISYTDFIRTTEPKHHEFIQEVLQKTYENWDIYKWVYEWMYCIWCEAFKTEKDLQDGKCPDHPNMEIQKITENNRFFKLSKYQKFLEELYENNPEWCVPHFRFNEIKSFVKSWLADFSVSRESNKFGIKLPFDDEQVAYVWYDALFNYVTLCQNWDEDFWPADVHVLWKEIARFHAIYWPAMLEASWYELPWKIFITWFLTIDGQKISKSLWNVICPAELSKDYTRDSIVLYLFSDLQLWSDWDFSTEKFKWMYDSILLWSWGNLVSRVCKLAAKNWVSKWCFYLSKHSVFKNILSEKDTWTNWELYNKIVWLNDENIQDFVDYINWFLDKPNIWWFLKEILWIVYAANYYMQENEPWVKIKDESTKNEWLEDLEFLLYLIWIVWIVSSWLFVDGFEKLKIVLWNNDFNQLSTWKDYNWENNLFFKLLCNKEFPVNLDNSEYLYKRIW